MDEDSSLVFSHVLKEDETTFSRWMLTVSEFKGVQYLNIREYFLDFEAEWKPTKKGISIPLELMFTTNLLTGLIKLLENNEI